VSSFDTRAYWEDRLGADWSLRGVGFRRMGRSFNQWAYRLRGERFTSVVEQFLPDISAARVLDVGSGTGFYIDAWRRMGVREITGMDLTEAAVTRLRGAFPEIEFLHHDISKGFGALAPNTFDVVSSMDVMFHIVDNDRFSAALRHVAALLKPAGHFVWSDFFVHGRETVGGHIAWRSLYRIDELLRHAGLEIVARRPLFYWMNEPRDSSNRALLAAWKGLMWLGSSSDRAGEILGRGMYHVDRELCRRRDEGPSTEIMVCRKLPG
jgi:2-polyprenyl-3-methyl-5-hydroxy-6-metoxy-1,4-benzoquinol methylase